jgi:LysM repeat protein
MPIKAAITSSPPPNPLFTLHTVQEEETLISIAARYDVTAEALVAANDIRDPTDLPVGQPLLIPPREGLRMPVVLHQVETGDKLLTIAAKYGSSVNDIMTVNPGLDADSLPVGQTVAVPIIFNQPKMVSQSRDASQEVIYVVQSGDIPLSIAAQFDVPVEILLAANDIIDPTLLQIGQELTIPPHEGITLGFPVILYELGEHDSLLGLASKYGSSIKDILAVNPDLIPSSLEVGQIVAIPIIFRIPKPTPSPNEAPPAPIEVSEPLVDLERQMVVLVNEVRSAEGLPPYQFDEEVATIAQGYAQDMVVRDFFSHVSPEGITLGERFTAQEVTDFMRVGENIQRNTRPRPETAQAALNWFLGSPPHRQNILHEYHNRIGVGIVEGPPGWYTIVLNFAQR